VRGTSSPAIGPNLTGWKPVPHRRLPRGTAFQAVRAGLGCARTPRARPPGRGSQPHGLEARASPAPLSWHGLPTRECRPHGQDARVDEHLAVALFPSFEALAPTVATWAEGREANGRITVARRLAGRRLTHEDRRRPMQTRFGLPENQGETEHQGVIEPARRPSRPGEWPHPLDAPSGLSTARRRSECLRPAESLPW
jgi:hypothetical protein